MRTIETMNAMIKTIIANNLTFLFIGTSMIIVKQATIPPWYNNLPMPPCKAVTPMLKAGCAAALAPSDMLMRKKVILAVFVVAFALRAETELKVRII